jgi:hypothetical protein
MKTLRGGGCICRFYQMTERRALLERQATNAESERMSNVHDSERLFYGEAWDFLLESTGFQLQGYLAYKKLPPPRPLQ